MAFNFSAVELSQSRKAKAAKPGNADDDLLLNMHGALPGY
jgi:hypothetical protein